MGWELAVTGMLDVCVAALACHCSYFIFTFIYLWRGEYAPECVWRSEDNLQEYVFSFHHMGSGDQTQVVKLGSNYTEPSAQAHQLSYFKNTG